MTSENGGWIEFSCLEVTQPIGTYYIGVLDSHDLVRLSYADRRDIKNEGYSLATYLGIQRELDEKRVEEIKEYVTTVDASFPSSIIVAVSSESAQYDPERKVFRLEDREDVARILDGQHRIAGLEGYDNDDFRLIVTVFVDMDIENQAMLFATINLAQTKVNKSLAYDLYAYTKARSPQKTAHNIVKLLNSEESSPLRGKVKMLGRASDSEETLSQAAFVDSLLEYLSTNPMSDRDLLKRGKKPARAAPGDQEKLIFRHMFLEERDADIARVLWNFFSAVQNRWGESWRAPIRGIILNRTTGFKGLMQFLRYAYLELSRIEEIPGQENFSILFDRVKLEGSDFTPENFPPGTGGQTKLRRRLLADTGLGPPLD